jgi:hypothetical protein
MGTQPHNKLYYRPAFEDDLILDPPRKLFVEAINRVTPEVAERLLADVGPVYREVKAQYDFTVKMVAVLKACADPATGKDFKRLRQAIFSWADEFNLGGNLTYTGANWIHECGLYTLAIHEGHLRLPDDGAITVNLESRTPVSFTIDTEGFITFKVKAWDPYSNDIERYKDLRAKELQLALDFYVDQVFSEASYLSVDEASRKTSPEHYDWLALFIIRGWDYHKIADEYGAKFGRYVEPSRIGHTIRANASAIDFYSRPTLGRPRKTAILTRPTRKKRYEVHELPAFTEPVHIGLFEETRAKAH